MDRAAGGVTPRLLGQRTERWVTGRHQPTDESSVTKLLHVVGYQQNARGALAGLADAHIQSVRQLDRSLEVDVVDIWRDPLPCADRETMPDSVNSFVALRSGGGAEDAASAGGRFASADRYLFSVPFWNGDLPERLKSYIDHLMQPGLLFRHDINEGYRGLLAGKSATVIQSHRGSFGGSGHPHSARLRSTYLEWWLRSVGVSRIDLIEEEARLIVPAVGSMRSHGAPAQESESPSLAT